MLFDSSFLFLLAHVLLGYGMAYPSPSSIQRPCILLAITACSLLSVRSPMWGRLFGGANVIAFEYIIGFIFHSSHWLCLVQLSPPPDMKSTGKKKARWAFNQVFNGRWGIAYLPPFDRKDPQYTPSRPKLFLQRLWDLLWTIGLIYLLDRYQLNIEPEDFLTDDPHVLLRLFQITPRELIIRCYMFVHGYGLAYLALRAAHSLGSCLALAWGDSPERWPPLFGSLQEAVTVRRWYSLFWHHLMRKAFTAHAIFVVTRIFHLPRKGRISRSLIMVLTFMFSALLHTLASPGIELCGLYFQVRYYLLIVFAVLCEDLVISIFRSWTLTERAPKQMVSKGKDGSNAISASTKAPTYPDANILWNLVGFSWVITFQTLALSEMGFGQYVCYTTQIS